MEFLEPMGDIHTRVPANIKKRVKEYGKGSLKRGIINLVELLDKQTVTVKVIVELNI